jgi:hypothetical protein
MKIDFLINLAKNLDESIFKSWEEAIDFYYKSINFPDVIDPDFFSLLYLISDGEFGLIIGEGYGYELESELNHFFPHEDWLFDRIIDSDIETQEERAIYLGEYLFSFYQSIKDTELCVYFINEYKYRLVDELTSRLYIYITREKIYEVLGESLLIKLRKYNLL